MAFLDSRNFLTAPEPTALAEIAADRLLKRIAASGNRPAICLNGGSSPKQLYKLLSGTPYKDKIPWERTHWFIGDDRFVAPDNPLSNMGMARRILLDRCAPPENIHAIPTDTHNPDEASRLYESALKSFYGAEHLCAKRPLFDVVLLGLGPDGHTASLFPGALAVSEQERWVVGVENAHVEPFVSRVTLTLPALASCREMIFLISGAAKRAILKRVLSGEDLPAARALSQGQTTWINDLAALPEHLS